MAEREGFEPSIEFPLYTLSKRAPSTTRPSLLLVGCSSKNNMRADAQPLLRPVAQIGGCQGLSNPCFYETKKSGTGRLGFDGPLPPDTESGNPNLGSGIPRPVRSTHGGRICLLAVRGRPARRTAFSLLPLHFPPCPGDRSFAAPEALPRIGHPVQPLEQIADGHAVRAKLAVFQLLPIERRGNRCARPRAPYTPRLRSVHTRCD
jgi:hypothetical protein